MSDYQPKKSPSQWISIQEAAHHAPYSQEYLSLLARRGKIFAKKIGRNWYTTHEALERYVVELASTEPNLMDEFKRLNPQVFGSSETKSSNPNSPVLPNVSTAPVVTPEPVVVPPIVAPIIPEVNSNNSVLQKLDRLSDSLETFASSVTQAIPNIIQANQTAPLDPEVEEFIQDRNNSKIHRFKHFNRFSKSTTRSPVGMVTIAITAVVLLFILVGGFSFGKIDNVIQQAKKAFTDATTIQGHFAGTHANEVLILDKAGNVNIYGHIETQGQFRSYAPDGVAPFVVDSMTKVDNLNADYLDNLQTKDFSLAFVTKNGNLTYEDVNLEGNVEVGKTLTVKGATKLMDSLQVYGTLGVFSDATFGKNVTLTGGDLTIKKGNLILGQGTLTINNSTLIKNLNAEFLNGTPSSGINLQFVTLNGNSTSNAITVGGLNVNGTSNFNGVGFFNTGVWGSMGSFGTLGVGGSTSIGDKNNPSNTSFVVYSNKFSIDANGNVGIGGSTTTGNLLVAGSVLSSLIPSGSFNLGSSTNPWSNLFVGNGNFSGSIIVSGSLDFPGVTSNSFVINTDNATSDSENSYLAFSRGLISPDARLTWDSTLKQFSFNEPVNVASGSFTVAVGPVGIGTTAPVDSALLDLTSTTRGFLAPRMTQAQRDAISAPAGGLLIFNTDTTTYNAYNGLTWLPVGALKTREGSTNVQLNSNTLTFNASDFNVTASGSTDTLVGIDYINGPASRSIDQTITGHWTFANGASVSTNFEVGGYASIGGNLFLRGDLSFNGTDHTGLRLNNLTTAQRDLISTLAGQTIFNTSVTKMQVYNGTDWKNVGNPEIGAEVTAGTAGSVLFVDSSGNLGQDNNNFYWDVANRRLGIGTKTPTTVLEVQGTASASYGLFGTLQVGGFASASYNRFGTGISTNGLASSNDLLVSGLFENIGNAFFRSNASVSTNFEVGGYASIGGNTTIAGTLTGNSTGSNSFAGSLDIIKGLRASQITGTGLTLNGNGNFTGNVGIGTDLIVTGQSSFSNASASLGFESNYLKTDNISNSTGTLQINAFTLGGLVTGNNQNILGLNQLTANIASVSTNFEVGGYASIGGNATIAGTLGVTGSTTLTGTLTGLSVGSNSFAGSLDVSKGIRGTYITATSGLISNSLTAHNGGPLTIGAFTLGGLVTGNNQNILGLNQLTANIASVSTNFEVGGYASIGGNTTIKGTLGVTGNTTLTGILTSNYTGSNSFAGSLDITKGLRASNFTQVGNSNNYFLGNLAIGNATPNATLDVSGTASASFFYGGSNGGTAGTPVFTFANDTNTGIFNPSADALAFSTNGAERFRIDNNGNFGIGTKNLETNFELVGTASISGNLIVGGFTQVNGNASSSFEGPLTLHGIPLGTAINQGSLYINPSTSGPNNLLFGAAVGGVEQLRLDASGNLKIVGVFNSTSVTGTNQLSGNLLVDGNTTLGGTIANTVSFTAQVNTDVLPSVDNQFNLGSATNRWASIYADNAHFSSNTSLPGVASASFTIFTGNMTNDASSSYLAFHRGTATPDARIMWDAVNKEFNFNFPVYLLNNLLVAGTATSSFAGPTWFTSVPTGAGVQNGALYVNPAGAAVDTTVFGVAVNNVPKFKVDAEGDTFVYGDATITNGQTIQGATGLVLSGTNAPLTFTNTGNHDVTASGGTLRLGAFTLLGAITGGGNAITGLGQLGVANASASGNFEANNSLIANNTLQVGGLSASASYNRFGTALTAHGLSANTDVLISGKMEVQGSTYFTGTVNFSGIASASAFYAHPGTSASPSFAFSIDQNTGFFRKSADSLSISTGGAERLNLTNTTASISNTLYLTGGNVGIGTSVPTATLNVNGTAQIGTAAWPSTTFTQNGSKLLITDINTPALIINNAYNTISANSGAEIYLGARGTTSTNDSAYVRIIGARENAASGNFSTYFNIKTMGPGGSEVQALRIDSTGNVGIGTTAPLAGAHIYASQASKTMLGDSRQLILENSDRTLNDRVEIGLGYMTGATYQPVVLGTIMTSSSADTKGDFYIATRDVTTDTAPTTRFIITSGGNVGINSGGTVDTQFEVGGTASISGALTLGSTLTVAGNSLFSSNASVSTNFEIGGFASASRFFAQDGTALLPSYTFSNDLNTGLFRKTNDSLSISAGGAERLNLTNTTASISNALYINSSGNVGIGTTGPGAKLQVTQSDNVTSLLVQGGGTGADIAKFARTVGGNGYVAISSGNSDPTLYFNVEESGAIWYMGVDDSDSDRFGIQTSGTFGSTDQFSILTTGNVGIGTTVPGLKLDVANGSIRASNYLVSGNAGQFAGTATVSYSRFGTDATSHGLSLANDLLISGKFEVDSGAFLDSFASVSTNFEVGGYASIGGNTTIAGTLGVTGNTTLTGTLTSLSIGSNSFAGSLNASLGIHAGGNSTTLAQFLSSGTGSNSFSGSLDVAKGIRGTSITATTGLISNSLTAYNAGPLTIGAFTLGGAVTGNNQSITGLNQLTTTVASISNNLELTNNASIGGNVVLKGNLTDLGTGSSSFAGSLNTSLGLHAGGNSTTSALFLGSGVGSNSFAGSLNLAKGLLQTGTSTNYFTGNVGIGTSTPQQLLDVYGETSPMIQVRSNTINGGQIKWGSSLGTWQAYMQERDLRFYDTADRFTLQYGGNVGIGSTAPTARLDIVAGAGNGAMFRVASASGITAFYVAKTGNVGIGTTTADDRLAIYGGTSGNIFEAYDSTGASKFVLNNSGNIGIGESNPTALFEVKGGTASISSTMWVSPSGYTGNVGIGTSAPTALMSLYSTATASFDITSSGLTDRRFTLVSNNTSADRFDIRNGANTSLVSIASSGNVGIGSTSPAYKLDVAGAINATGLNINGIAVGTANQWTTLGSSIYYNTGNVGIGSTAPTASLNIVGTAGNNALLNIASSSGTSALYVSKSGNVGIGTTTPDTMLVIGTPLNSTGNIPGITVSLPGINSRVTVGQDSTHNAGITWAYNATPASAVFNVTTYGYYNPINIDGSATYLQVHGGNVGIGTTAPVTKLDVAGTIRPTSLTDPTSGTGLELGYHAATTAGVITAYDRSSSAYKNLRLNDVIFITGGSTSGNVGIGTTAPSKALDVTGYINATTGLCIAGVCQTTWPGGGSGITGSGTSGYLTKWNGASTVTNSVIYDNGTNVGIGTTAPDSLLSVMVNANSYYGLHLSNTSNGTSAGARLLLSNDNNNADIILLSSMDNSATYGPNDAGNLIVANRGGAIKFRTGSYVDANTRMTILSGGNVGIGTTAPQRLLDVSSATDSSVAITSAVTGQSSLWFADTDTNIGGILYTHTNNQMEFRVNDASRMVIDSAGNVGIGTTSPAAKLDILGTAGNNALMNVASASGTSVLRITKGGNVGIGSTSPAYKLDVAGTVNATSFTVGGVAVGNQWPVSGSDISYSTGNVSIGTTVATQKLEVNGSIRLTNASGGAIVFADGTTMSSSAGLLAGDSSIGDVNLVADTDNNSTGNINFVTGSSNKMVILNNGNVGIGTALPTALFEVNGAMKATSLTISGTSTFIGGLSFGSFASVSTNFEIGGYASIGGNAYIKGNVGIGTTSPTALLSLVGTAGNNALMNIASSSGTSALYVSKSGNVGIGTTAPAYTFDVNGTLRARTTEATGGTITHSGGYTIHTFTTSGTFTVPADFASSSVEYLVVAGGGGGSDGAGGGGGMLTSSGFAVTTQAYTITVGAGGAGKHRTTSAGSNGSNSVFSSVTAIGGGGGGGANGAGVAGGSGGGSGSNTASLGGAGTSGQGNTGGNTAGYAASGYPGGSGGGASAVGQNAQSTAQAGAGGAGLASSISGSTVTYAGGGGGGLNNGAGVGAGGAGGGGAGASGVADGVSGTVNTGGGGGAAGNNGNGGTGGTGGSGIVIVRYLTPASVPLISAIFGNFVGVGTTTPLSALDVNGGVAIGSYAGSNIAPSNGMIMSGNVGIGTTAPRKLLQVQLADATTAHFGNTNFALNNYSGISLGFMSADGYYEKSAIVQAGTGDANARGKIMFLNNNTADNSSATLADARMTIQADGNVGIGTTGPVSLLNISGSNPIFVIAPTNNAGFGQIKNLGTSASRDADFYLSNYDTGKMYFRTSSAADSPATAMTIQTNGNVGIGTTTPNFPLTVWGNASIHEGTNQNVRFSVQSGNATVQAVNDAANAFTTMQVDGSTLSLNAQSGGNVGIGTTNPTLGKLQVQAGKVFIGYNTTTMGDGQLNISNEANTVNANITAINGGTRVGIQTYLSAVASGNLTLQEAGGNVGIGTTNPSSFQLQITGNGGKPGGGSWGDTSDVRLKTNIADIAGALDKITQLQPVSFNWINPTEHGGIISTAGFIAQDVAKIFPSWIHDATPSGADALLVGSGEKIKTLTLPFEYDAMVVGAIKELNTKSNSLAGQFEAFTAEMEAQCVTGETRLRRRRRRRRISNFQFPISIDGDGYEEVRIDQIQSGDEICSLNEVTGRVEFARVNALMDMGVQEVYELVTASGRKIRTTKNHPYLARMGA